MIDKKQFEKIRDELKRLDDSREDVIQKSREIIRLSKSVISSVHRGQADKKLIEKMKADVKKLPRENNETNMNYVALQEYVEAICFYEFMENGKIPTYSELKVDVQSYLLGLCDLTGELMRKSVNSVINKDYKTALRIRDFVIDLYDEVLKFDLRNGELRKKTDEIKWNLKKIEDVAYDIKIKGLA